MDIRRLELNLLLLLDGLLTSGNLSATARRLQISQPSASAGLSKLRHFFNDELFVRTGRGLRPTPFAEGLIKPLRSVIETINNEILLKPAFEPCKSDRVFTLTMPDLGEVIFLPPIIQRLHAEAPSVGLRCLAIPYAELPEALEGGRADIAIGYFPDLQESPIYSQLLFEDPFVCVVRNGHPKVGTRISLEQFLDLDHLVVDHEGRRHDSFEMRVTELGLKRRIRLHIPHFMSVPRLIANTDLISVVPLSLASWYAEVLGLRILKPPMAVENIILKQLWHRRLHNDPGIVWLRKVISEQLVGRDPRQAMLPDYGLQKPSAQTRRASVSR